MNRSGLACSDNDEEGGADGNSDDDGYVVVRVRRSGMMIPLAPLLVPSFLFHDINLHSLPVVSSVGLSVGAPERAVDCNYLIGLVAVVLSVAKIIIAAVEGPIKTTMT